MAPNSQASDPCGELQMGNVIWPLRENSPLQDLGKGHLCLARRTRSQEIVHTGPCRERTDSIPQEMGSKHFTGATGHSQTFCLEQSCGMKVSLSSLAPPVTPDCLAEGTGELEHSRIRSERSYFG